MVNQTIVGLTIKTSNHTKLYNIYMIKDDMINKYFKNILS